MEMRKTLIGIVCILIALSFVITLASYAQAEKETGKQAAKKAWQKLFNYPANVTKQSAGVVADTGKRGTEVVTKEVKRVGEVTSGDVAKTKELVTEPLTGTAETGVKAVEETGKIPVEAAKEE
jgi:hypothetical protein